MLGVCYTWSNGRKLIKINTKYWSDFTEDQRLQLVYHELGHCFLGREHNNNFIHMDDEIRPESIMRSYMFSEMEAAYFINKKVYYDNELLGRE